MPICKRGRRSVEVLQEFVDQASHYQDMWSTYFPTMDMQEEDMDFAEYSSDWWARRNAGLNQMYKDCSKG